MLQWCITGARTHISRLCGESKLMKAFIVGNANTLFCSAGIPQIICPAWFDLYTMAARVEYLKIGFHASKTSAPDLNASGIADGLINALDLNPGNGEGEEMRQCARRLGEITRAYGGVKVAVDKILELAKDKKFQRP